MLIIGAGPIGLSVLEFLKIAEAKITVLDMVESRLDFCKNSMGVHHTIQFSGDGSELDAMKADTDGCLYTIVIDATGNPHSMSNALNYVAHAGTMVYVGITTEEIHFPHPLLHAREMTVKGSRNSLPKDFKRIISLIEDGSINTEPWITHRVPFEGMIDAFESFTKPETGVIKAVVEVGT